MQVQDKQSGLRLNTKVSFCQGYIMEIASRLEGQVTDRELNESKKLEVGRLLAGKLGS